MISTTSVGRETAIARLAASLTILSVFLLMLSSSSFTTRAQDAAKPATTPAAPPPPNEVRALWVVRTTLTSKEKIKTMVESASSAGFNTLIVQVRGRGDSYYRAQWEPRAVALKDQPADFDPLAATLTEAKRKGLKVHAWINTNLLANLDELPTEAEHIYNARPDWLAVPRAVATELYNMTPSDSRYRAAVVEWSKANRAELEGVYVSPAHPAVREHIYSIWMDILSRYELDGLHFDYVRFASPDFDYSRASLERFRTWLEPRLSAPEKRLLETALKADPLAAAASYKEQFADFQREQVTSLVERIYYGVKKRRPGWTVSAAVFANDENAHTRRFQDWRRWLSMGVLDVACLMAYTTDTETFRKQIEVAVASAKPAGRRVWAGIGAYRVPAESAIEKINAARAAGADGIILFSYDFTLNRSPLNPEGDYLQRVRKGAFDMASQPAQ
ncbi:MAG: family 10 glycosylhydrolase [Acidobacteria bacterium]|nr:family 10 glycosylhydrolase [Acidobacteriota bacterium]